MSFTLSGGNPPHYVCRARLPGVRHGFFTARGGVSTGSYASLNCGPGSNDDIDRVAENRGLVARAMRIEPHRLARIHQVHGNTAVPLEGDAVLLDPVAIEANSAEFFSFGQAPMADAIVTRVRGLGLSILTADCLPVLLADVEADTPVVAACHAGWRGAAGGIIQSTIHLMRKCGAANITALVGPAIRQPNYQVARDMREQLLEMIDPGLRDAALSCFAPDDTGTGGGGADQAKYRFDLPGLARHVLQKEGVARIHDCGLDTYDHTPSGAHDDFTFFSHRRATHDGVGDAGRQISVIALEP